MGRLILVGGGMRSGKSRFALELADALGKRRAFFATARVTDEEMRERIARHRAERADRYANVECPTELPETLRSATEFDVILVDCLTFWIANLLELELENAEILARVDQLISAAVTQSATTIVVSNEVGMGLVAMSPLARKFQDLTGWAHQRLSSAAAEVHVAIMGCILRLRPGPVEVMQAVRGPNDIR